VTEDRRASEPHELTEAARLAHNLEFPIGKNHIPLFVEELGQAALDSLVSARPPVKSYILNRLLD
jgi:hypothetical protein